MTKFYLNDERINISRSLMSNVTYTHEFGATPQISNGVTSTIWDVTDTIYPWSAFATPGVLNIDRTVSDAANTVVRLEGLDSDYNVVTEDITLTNLSNNTGTQVFARLNNAYVQSNSGTNAGNITIQIGTTTVGLIRTGKGRTMMSVYTIPAGYTGYLMQGIATLQKGEGMTVEFYIRPYGGIFRIQHEAEVSGDAGPYNYKFEIPSRLPAKTDLDVRAIARTNNIRATSAFDIILIRDPS